MLIEIASLGACAIAGLWLLFTLEHATFSSFLYLIFAGMLAFGLGVPFDMTSVTWVLQHPLTILSYFGAYVGIATIWVWFAWLSYLGQIRDCYIAGREQWIAVCGGEAKMTPEQKAQIPTKAAYYSGVEVPVKVSTHKKLIITWMVFWPFSMVGTVLNDPIRRIFTAIYNAIGGGLQNIADRMFADIHADLK